jgi:hypothetical protein
MRCNNNNYEANPITIMYTEKKKKKNEKKRKKKKEGGIDSATIPDVGSSLEKEGYRVAELSST